MANTAWYDNNHSKDPNKKQGRTSEGKFTEDTIGGSEEEVTDKDIELSDVGSSFLQNRANEIGYKGEITPKKISRTDLSESILKSFLDRKSQGFDEQKMAEEYEEFLNSSSVPESLREDCRRAFSRGKPLHKYLLLNAVKRGTFKYVDTSDSKETSCCKVSKDPSKNVIEFNKNSTNDFATTFWHEHWHAIDIFSFKMPFKKEFDTDKDFVRRNAKKILDGVLGVRADIFKERTGYSHNFTSQNRENALRKVKEYENQWPTDIPKVGGPFGQLKALKKYGVELDEQAEELIKGYDTVINSEEIFKGLPNFHSIGDMLQAATGEANTLGGHVDGYFNDPSVWRMEFMAEFGAALALKDAHNKWVYKFFKAMFKGATKRMMEVFE